jgi:hypothetical protein
MGSVVSMDAASTSNQASVAQTVASYIKREVPKTL